ncbi:hypothetical protein NOI24_28740 [Neorhizobium galegae]|uniref:hypothetical protein n=1 Tax=Neorhizobium galegae TaxID=399 RepID=UPI002107F1B1|nr:hypothetical protein [Neorhizobium galegae]MCQ1775261.1 hypothetical protein [Neorhizobium galegae]MCQ1799914.1 hypothetical protein [Neorhizobium galegae]
MTDLYVAKVPDKTILEMLTELKEKYGSNHMGIDLGGVPLPENEFQLIRKRKGPTFLINSFSFNPGDNTFNVTMNRGNVLPSLNPAYYDVIKFDPVNGRINAEKVLEVEEVLRRHLTFPKANDAKGLAENTLGIIDRETASLAQLHHTMLENAENLRVSYEEDSAERRRKFEEQQLQAEEEIRRREAESLERIEAEKADLNEKLQQFDLSDHMRARRKQRDEITTQIQGFLLRPAGAHTSQSKMMVIMTICLLGFGLAGFFAYESFQAFLSKSQSNTISEAVAKILPQIKVSETAPPSETVTAVNDAVSSVLANTTTNDYMLWLLALRGVALSGVAIGFIVYLLTFIRRNHDEELRYHRELQRYGMDINRASWVIETAMEMTTKEGAQLPEKWVEGACAGLFQSGAKGDGEVSSLAALGAVMGLGPEVSVGPSGATLKLPPKAAKKAANDAE